MSLKVFMKSVRIEEKDQPGMKVKIALILHWEWRATGKVRKICTPGSSDFPGGHLLLVFILKLKANAVTYPPAPFLHTPHCSQTLLSRRYASGRMPIRTPNRVRFMNPLQYHSQPPPQALDGNLVLIFVATPFKWCGRPKGYLPPGAQSAGCLPCYAMLLATSFSVFAEAVIIKFYKNSLKVFLLLRIWGIYTYLLFLLAIGD